MLTIRENFNLTKLNTFGVEAKAKYFVRVNSEEEVKELINNSSYKNNRVFILGSGSNILFTKDFDGLIISSAIKGISVKEETEDYIFLKVGSGENWHHLVMYCVERNWGGIENLSLIPGQVGGAPFQNIGAYGLEVSDVIEEVNSIDLDTSGSVIFSNQQCQFAYRNSIFKKNNKYFITSVTFKLTKKNHSLQTDYKSLKEYMVTNKISTPTIKNISDAVIAIRRQKLVDPNEFGNAGSFFTNPIVSSQQLMRLKKEYPTIQYHNIDNEAVKIFAGWLIEQCGWKGKQINNVGVNKNQALVILNLGNATGEDILDFSQKIKSDVFKKFQIQLESEVTIL